MVPATTPKARPSSARRMEELAAKGLALAKALGGTEGARHRDRRIAPS